MRSSIAFASLASVVIAQQGYGAASNTAYACNPAHQYPNGQVCTTVSGSLTLVSTTSTPTASHRASYPTTSCPAPGTTDSKGRYSCNPAHQYPAGQECVATDDCYFLVYHSSSVTSSSTPTKPASYPTSSCPAAGSTDSKGRYSCNPAHQYPTGQECVETDGCYFLVYHSSSISTSCTTTTPASYPTSSCPAPGSTDSKGRYSCNPAHQYPAGQECVETDGCYFLVSHSSTVSTSCTTTSPASYPTSSCPAPGSTDSKGRYSCNPAHQYPGNQKCVEIDGCPYLVDQPPSTTATPSSTAPSHPTSSCSAAGTTDKQGRYSCNPAHQYPGDQKCVAVDGCYYLVHQSPPATVTPTVPKYTTKTHTVARLTTTCPAPGSTGADGCYSCNPAHQYPGSQTCELVKGCYCLHTPSASSSHSNTVVHPSSHTSASTVAPPPSYSSTLSASVTRSTTASSTQTPVPYTGAAAPMHTGAPLVAGMAVAAMGALLL